MRFLSLLPHAELVEVVEEEVPALPSLRPQALLQRFVLFPILLPVLEAVAETVHPLAQTTPKHL